jgi:hypothetical protein
MVKGKEHYLGRVKDVTLGDSRGGIQTIRRHVDKAESSRPGQDTPYAS